MATRSRKILKPKFGYTLTWDGRADISQGAVYETQEAAIAAAGKELNRYIGRDYKCVAYIFQIVGTVSLPVIPPKFTAIK